jgi:hypothetical protein
MITAYEQAKTVYALDRAATVTGLRILHKVIITFIYIIMLKIIVYFTHKQVYSIMYMYAFA